MSVIKQLTRYGTGDSDSEEAVVLTASQQQRLQQIAEEFGVLIGSADGVRMHEAVLKMLDVFIKQGGMPVDQALQMLAKTMRLTREKLSDPFRRH